MNAVSDLAGEDDIESALLDSLADLHRDFQTQVRPYFGVVAGRMEGDKASFPEIFVCYSHSLGHLG